MLIFDILNFYKMKIIFCVFVYGGGWSYGCDLTVATLNLNNSKLEGWHY